MNSTTIMKNRFFVEIIQSIDGKYNANMKIEGKSVEGLPESVDYKSLKEAIKNNTGIIIPCRKSLIFHQSRNKKYAYIDATQPCKRGCVVTLEDMQKGHKPNFE